MNGGRNTKLLTVLGFGFGSWFLLAPATAIKAYGIPEDQITPAARSALRYYGGRILAQSVMLANEKTARVTIGIAPVFTALDLAAAVLSNRDEGSSRTLAMAGGTTLAIGALSLAAKREFS